MNECILKRCNGSGVIWMTGIEGSGGVSCECMNLKKADIAFKNSNAPQDMKIFLEELSFNPDIQSINKMQRVVNELKQNFEGEELGRKIKMKLPETLSPMRETLSQFKEVNHFIENNYRLVFCGETGTGKSQSAVSFAYSTAKEKNEKFYYISMHSIQNLFRFNFNDEDEVKRVEKQKQKMEEANILIIDDLGKEIDKLNLNRETDRDLLKKIHDYLDAVMRTKARMVIITSNAKKEVILDAYKGLDKRFISKLLDGNVVYYDFHEKIRAIKTDSQLDKF